MEVKPNWDSENIFPSTEITGVLPIEVYTWIFFWGPNFVSPEWRCPKGEVPIYMNNLNVISVLK